MEAYTLRYCLQVHWVCEKLRMSLSPLPDTNCAGIIMDTFFQFKGGHSISTKWSFRQFSWSYKEIQIFQPSD